MNPGQELDALIAEKVLKWCKPHSNGTYDLQPKMRYSGFGWTVELVRGNSLLLRTDPENQELAKWFDQTIVVSAPLAAEFMKLPNVLMER